MPKLRNAQSGAVVSCSEATAARLGSEWKASDEAERKPKRPTRKKAESASDEK